VSVITSVLLLQSESEVEATGRFKHHRYQTLLSCWEAKKFLRKWSLWIRTVVSNCLCPTKKTGLWKVHN